MTTKRGRRLAHTSRNTIRYRIMCLRGAHGSYGSTIIVPIYCFLFGGIDTMTFLGVGHTQKSATHSRSL